MPAAPDAQEGGEPGPVRLPGELAFCALLLLLSLFLLWQDFRL